MDDNIAKNELPMGLLEVGNIDLTNRPIVRHADGSYSTVATRSFNFGGQEVVLPTVSEDGRMMEDDEAIQQYRTTGRHFGKFDTIENAEAFGRALHEEQDLLYRGRFEAGEGAAPTPVADTMSTLVRPSVSRSDLFNIEVETDTTPYSPLLNRPRHLRRRPTVEDLEQSFQDELASRRGPTTMADVEQALRRARKEDMDVGRAISTVGAVAERLPEDQFRRMPAIVQRSDGDKVWMFRQKHPELNDFLNLPEFHFIFGDKFEPLDTMTKIWYALPGATGYLGLKSGWLNMESRKSFQDVFLGNKSLSDPEVIAERQELNRKREELADLFEKIDYDMGVLSLIPEFGINAGEVLGGMVRGAATPEGAIGLLAGAAIGAVSGGTGLPLGAAASGLLTGSGVAMAEAEAGETMWEIWESQPDELKDQTLAETGALFTFLFTAAAENIGAHGMLNPKVGEAISRSFIRNAGKISPSFAASATRVLQSRGTKLAAELAVHTAPEIVTETLEEGFQTAIQIPLAEAYNDLYRGTGLLATKPELSDVLSSMGHAAWKTFWGGAAPGAVHPLYHFWRDRGKQPTLDPEAAKRITDAAIKQAHVSIVADENARLRTGAKELTATIRGLMDEKATPEAVSAVLETQEEKPVYVNAEVLNRLFQAEREKNPETDADALAAEVLEPLGVTAEQFAEALDSDTDVLINLRGMPEVVNHPLWDQITDALTVEPAGVTEDMITDLGAMGPPPAIMTSAVAEVSGKTRKDLETRLRAAGRTKAEARREEQILSRMAGILTRATGEDPNAWLNENLFLGKEKVPTAPESFQAQEELSAAALPMETRRRPKGLTEVIAGGRYRVAFSPKADASTAMHEFEHVFINEALRVLALDADKIADETARAQLERDIVELADWAGLPDYKNWDTETHEKVARAFEQYMMEGKAPVKELKGIFSRMRQLLLGIYNALKSLGEPLSDDVRRVFDRQLATDEELSVESWRGKPILDLEEMREVDPKLYAEYVEAAAKADRARDEEIIDFRNAEHERLVRQWRREGRKLAEDDLRMIRIKEIKRVGGMSRDSLEAIGFGPATLEFLRKRGLISKDKGKRGADEFAAEYGFDSADDFIQDLLTIPTIKKFVDDYVAAQEAEFENYFNSDSILTNAELDKWEMERDFLGRSMAGKDSKYANRSWRDIKKIIDRKTGVKPIDEIVAQNMADLRASLKAQARAALAGKREGKREAQAKAAAERLELGARLKSLAERQRDVAKAIATFKRIAGQKTAQQYRHGGILPSFHSQIKGILHEFGIGPAVTTETSLANFVAQEQANNSGLVVADWLVNGDWPTFETGGKRVGRRIPLKSLPLNQFQELQQAITNLTFLGRRSQGIMVAGQLQDLNSTVERLVVGAEARVKVKPPATEKEIFEDTGDKNKIGSTLLNFFQGFMPALLKVETICRVLDGGEYGGTWQQIVYEPINKAYHDTLARTEKLTADIGDLVENIIGKKELLKWRGEKLVIEGVPWTFTKEQLFMYIMHLGNKQNTTLARRFDFNNDGSGVSDIQHQALMDAAPKEMWDMAQTLWDYQDKQMFPELDALTRRTTGLPLKKVEAEAVISPYGEYRGGYSPIVFDRRMSRTAEKLEAAKDSNLAAANAFRPGKTNAGATIERVGVTYNDLRALLSFDALTNSWSENVYDLGYREATSDIKRVLADRRIRQTITGAFSDQHLKQFDLWLQEQIAPGSERKSTLSGVDAGLKMIRRNLSTAAMGGKASVALCQPSGIFQAMHKIGMIQTSIGIASFFGGFLTGGRPFLNELYKKSPELGKRNTSGSFDRDIGEAFKMRNPLHKVMRDRLDDVAFKVISIFDQLTANSVWTGAYLQSLKKGQSEATAVEYANSVVRTTQGTGASKDLSYVQRGMGYGDLGKIFTMFGTFFSASQNLFWEQYQLTKRDIQTGQYGKAAKGVGSATLFMALLPAIYDALIRDGIPDDEDDLADIGKGMVSYYVGGIPVVKDLISTALGTSYRFTPAPILEALPQMTTGLGRGVWDVLTGEEGGATKIVRGLGGWTGLPTGQITTTMKGIEEWDEREGVDALYRLLVRESPK